MPRRRVVAILCSDIHLQLRPPVARSVEDDWFEAMRRPMRQVRDLQQRHECPVLIAGDIFDRWNAPPEVINFAIDELPDRVYAIPGQHDLPHHDYNARHRSAYGTLAKAGRIVDLEAGMRHPIPGTNIMVSPFPWGVPIETVDPEAAEFQNPDYDWLHVAQNLDYDWLHVALIHRYVWKTDCGYPGAPKEAKLGAFKKVLTGYAAAVFGDNHKGFHVERGPVNVLNCGGFMRRKIDEVSYEPHVGLLFEDGLIDRVALDCSEDEFIDVAEATAVVERALEMGEFVAELSALGKEGLDFLEAVKRFLDNNHITGRIREIALAAVELRV